MSLVGTRADEALRPAAADGASSILSAIERVASNPEVDFQRFQWLLEKRDAMEAKEAQKAFTVAFAKMQSRLPVIDQNGTIVIHHKDDGGKPVDQRRVVQSTPFAKWEDINEAITPILGEHGFTLSFSADREGDKVIINASLEHVAGHAKSTSLPLALDTTGSKNNVQAVGSSLSYGQRYTARLLLNFTSRAKADRDDDGNSSEGPALISEDQVIALREMAESVNADMGRFCHHLKIAALAALRADRFDYAMAKLRQKAAAQ